MEKIKAKSEPARYDGIEKDSDPKSFGPHMTMNAPTADKAAYEDVEHGPGIELAKKLGK